MEDEGRFVKDGANLEREIVSSEAHKLG